MSLNHYKKEVAGARDSDIGEPADPPVTCCSLNKHESQGLYIIQIGSTYSNITPNDLKQKNQND